MWIPADRPFKNKNFSVLWQNFWSPFSLLLLVSNMYLPFFCNFFCVFCDRHVSPSSTMHQLPCKQQAVPVRHMEEKGGVSAVAHLHLKMTDTYTSAVCTGLLFNASDRVRKVLRDVRLDEFSPRFHQITSKDILIRTVLVISPSGALNSSPPRNYWRISGLFITPLISIRGCHIKAIYKGDTDLSLKITHYHLSHSLCSGWTSTGWLQ